MSWYYCAIHRAAEPRPTVDSIELPRGVLVALDYSHVAIGPYPDQAAADVQGPADFRSLPPAP